ncbi:MAG: DUF177 domain-containing protein [Persephonella sp.]|nr:MAG: DUF177 domain-containing protein [Persephonella sp.]RUM61176.1 MAG: DUF177 domain-containing protein [Persephonella sp.]
MKDIYINLKEELKHEDFIEKDYSLPVKSLDLPSEYSSDKKDLDIHLYIIKEKDGYVLSMDMKGELKVECSRCLEPFNMNIKNVSNVMITTKRPTKQNQELTQDDLMVEYIDDYEKFNLTNFVREEILIQTPIKPLCNEECKGICPICGGNKNENPCDCEKKLKRESSPFSKLKELLEKKQKKEK